MMADAAGLGRITVFSALGQPLRAEIEVSAVKEEIPGMAARIAPADAFRDAGLEYAGILASVHVKMDKAPNGQPVIKLSTDRPVSEPFLDVLLELNWPAGRLVREYTFLLDPPEVTRQAPAAGTAGAETAPVADKKAAAMPAAEAAAPAAKEKKGKTKEKAEKVEKPVVAEKAGAEAGAASRQVKTGDTLAKIAAEVKPEGVALDQMLVGLFRANPEAFQGNNMNRLKSGAILNVPAADALADKAAAHKEVLAQAQDWNAYRRKLAGVVAQEPAADKPAQKASAGKITAKVEDKAPKPVDTKDQVKVSKTDSKAAQAPATKKASAEEEKLAREKALKESAERAAQLEKNIADLQKLSDMKNKQLAQAQAAAKPAEPPKAVEPAKAPEPPKPAEPPKPTEAAKPAEEKAAGKPTEAPKPEAAKPADAPKPKPKAPPPPPVEEDDDGMGLGLVGGAAALLAGIGGLLFYRRRKAKATETPIAAPSISPESLGANSVFRATGGQSVDTSAATPAVTDFSQTGPGTIDTDEVDPVAEAEVYMAYGRDAQAEEILLEALQKDSKRLAIHLKLLEIYSQRKSVKQFEMLATELYSQTGGFGPDWEKAVAMGAALDPANPLYSSGAGAVASTSFSNEAPEEAYDPEATVVVAPDSVALDVPPPAEPVFELPPVDVPAVEAAAAPEAAPAAAEAGLSFDFNIGGDEPAAAPAFEPNATVVRGPEAETPKPAADSIVLDFDLDLGGTTTDRTAEAATPASAAASANELDFNLGDSNFAPPQVEAEAAAARPDFSAINLDLSAPADNGVMDLEKTMLAPAGSDALATNILGSAPGLGGGEAAGGGDAMEQAVATKLDLAKAYEEMGDAEGARELLQEVLAEGSAAQKEAANAMLARLG